ncbi:unnamed protein product [Phytophthora lilii]|uniref:Unnamed protein product n=1 Tax=Phytophthora lilii TaxID=2077276 RepID=A0A9W6YJU1_9STRA|nr:unnamed protein product [Phytophthora lilii]
MQHAWHLSEENNDVKKPHQEEFSTSVSSTPSAPMPLSHQDVSPSNCPKYIMTAKPAFKGDAPPSEIWSYLRLLLLFPQQRQNSVNTWPTQDSMCRRLGANRILGDGNEVMNLKAFAQSLAILDKRLTQKEAYDLSRFVAACCAKEFGNSETIVMKSLYRMLMTTLDEKAGGELFSDINYIEYYASRAIERIRARVIKNKAGTSEGEMSPPVDLGILEKWLHQSSSNGDTLLMKYELKSGLQKVGIDISYQDLDYIFAYFDVDRLGYISCDVIMEGLRCESDVPLKLAKPQEKSSANSEVKPMNAAIDNEEPRPTYTAVSLAMNHRKRQVAKREPLPNFRRRNLIHRAIWDQSVKPETAKSGELEPERRRRYLAARIIQTTFRVFRARQIAAQLRRKAAAKKHRLNALSQERQQLLVKKKANRVALPSAYGF